MEIEIKLEINIKTLAHKTDIIKAIERGLYKELDYKRIAEPKDIKSIQVKILD